MSVLSIVSLAIAAFVLATIPAAGKDFVEGEKKGQATFSSDFHDDFESDTSIQAAANFHGGLLVDPKRRP